MSKNNIKNAIGIYCKLTNYNQYCEPIRLYSNPKLTPEDLEKFSKKRKKRKRSGGK